MRQTTVLQVGGLHWATSGHAIETALLRQAGVKELRANAANQSATVTYDPDVTSVAELTAWVRDCGYHCAGRSVPNHVCEPMAEPALHEAGVAHGGHRGAGPQAGHDAHGSEGRIAPTSAATVEHSAQEMMGPGGHGGKSKE